MQHAKALVVPNAAAFPFFDLFFSMATLDGMTKVFCVCSVSWCCKHVWPVPDILHRPTLANSYVYVQKFCAWKHGMPYVWKINSDDRFRRERMESCSSTIIVISPLPKLLWPPYLAEWWLNNRDARSLDKQKPLHLCCGNA